MTTASGYGLRVLLLLCIAELAQASPTARVVVERGPSLTRVSGEVSVTAEVATAWSVLTGYERMSDFVPGLTVSRVLASDDGTRQIEQRGEIRSGNLRMVYGNLLRVRELPPHDLEVEFVQGTFRGTRGTWNLRPQRGALAIGYRLDLDPATLSPLMIASPVMPEQVRLWAEALGSEVERRQKLAAPAKQRKE